MGRCLVLGLFVAAQLSAAIVVEAGPDAPEVERYAASELRRYLKILFGDRPRGAPRGLRFLVGSPSTSPAVAQALRTKELPVSAKGYAGIPSSLGGDPVFIVGGSAPAATLWAVYDLVEQWGVRYLIHRDILPDRPVFVLARFVREPALTVRQWRVANDMAFGPASWGIEQYKPVLDQLPKLRFNRILVQIWPHQPYLRYEFGGIRRTSSAMFFGQRFPFREDMVGRQLFPPHSTEFENPDIPVAAGPEQQLDNGIRHIRSIMRYAQGRGLDVTVSATITDFPAEFAPLFKNPQKVKQLGELTIAPGPDTAMDDPSYVGLARAVLQSTVATYPEASYVLLSMPEHRQWVQHYQRAWEFLDRKYRLTPDFTLSQLMEQASRRSGVHGGSARAVAEVQGDLVSLSLYDRLLEGNQRKIIYSGIAEELYPILGRILKPGSELLNFIDYTPSRVLARRQALRSVPHGEIGSQLIFTLHDDNVGPLPQLSTGPLAELTSELIRNRWTGFSTRYWLLGDHDAAVSHIAHAAWDPGLTPDGTSRQLLRSMCGAACVEPTMEAFRAWETATRTLELEGLGFAFPAPGMLMKFWEQPAKATPGVLAVRTTYQQALNAVNAALQRTPRSRQDALRYYAGRLQFAIDYLQTVAHVAAAGRAAAAGNTVEARAQAEQAKQALHGALQAYARVAMDQSDRGAVAALNELAWHPLLRKIESLPSQGR